MITTQELVSKYLEWYKENKMQIIEDEAVAKNKITSFLNRFGSEDKLRNLDLVDDYAFQAGTKRPTFCYLIDFGTDDLGVNRCDRQSGYQRYGIQLKSDGKWLPFCKSSDDLTFCEQEAKRVYQEYLEETIKLLHATEDNDEETIRSINMPKPHLNKLHFIFSKGKSINIFVNPDLNILLDLFGVAYSERDDVFIKRKLLLDYMNDTFRGIQITPWLFCRFLYSPLGLRPLWKLNKYRTETLCVDDEKRSVYLNNLVSKYEENQKLINDGSAAEDLFYEYIKSKPNDFGITDISKIKRIHNHPEIGVHCDFSYVKKSGKIMYVEVKSSFKRDKKCPLFYMSDLEYEFMLNNQKNYVLYYLPNAKKNKALFIKIMPNEIKRLTRPKQYVFDAI